MPFFVEELTAALRAGARLPDGPDGAGARARRRRVAPADGPRRRARAGRRRCPSRRGPRPRRRPRSARRSTSTLVAAIDGEDGLAELLGRAGCSARPSAGRAAFRHPLAREAIYDDVPWLRRRALHRRLAEALRARGADPAEVATHWLAARDAPRALEALLEAIAAAAAVHAYRDAARLGRQALEIWPEGERGARAPGGRRALRGPRRAGRRARRGGARPARGRRRAPRGRRRPGAGRRRAAHRGHLRAAGRPRRARSPRAASRPRPTRPTACRARRRPSGSSSRATCRAPGSHAEAAATAALAAAEAVRAERADLRARAMGLEGVARVKGGAFDEGVEIIRAGLSLALEHELTAEAAEVYQRLGTAREIAGDYGGARDALGTAIGLCESGQAGALEQVCLSCMAYVLRELGDWDQVVELCEGLIAAGRGSRTRRSSPTASSAPCTCGAAGPRPRGRCSSAACETAARLNVVSMQCDSAAALAWLAAEEGDAAAGVGAVPHRARALGAQRGPPLRRLGPALGRGALRRARARSATPARAPRALSAIAASAGHPDALAALADALAGDRARRGRRRRRRCSSSPARWRCTTSSRSRSSARRSSCTPAAALAAAGERESGLGAARRGAPDRAAARRRAARRARRRRRRRHGRLARGPARAPRGGAARARPASRAASSRSCGSSPRA